MRKLMLFFTLGCVALVTVLAGFCLGAPPVKPEDFYRGKTIELIVDQSPGSATDRMARVIQPYLAERTGATVVVKNMFGGGGLEGENYIWSANPNGLTIGATMLSNISAPNILGASEARYQVDKFGWIGCMGLEEVVVWTGTKGRIKSFPDLKGTKNLKFTSMGKTHIHALWNMSVAHWLDLDAKVLTGLSVQDTELLVLRGEADVSISTATRLLKGMKAGTHKGLFVLTSTGKRMSALPDLPELRELTKLDPAGMKYYELLVTLLNNVGKSLCTPPGVSKERLKFLRDTFTWITQQEKFNRDIEAMMGFAPIQYRSGQELGAEAAAIIANKKYLRDKFNLLINRYTD